MANIFGDAAGHPLSSPYYKGNLRGALAVAVEKFLTEQITVLVCNYSRTLRLMESMGAVRRDQPAIWKFPVDWQTVGSVPITERSFQASDNYEYFEPGSTTGQTTSSGFRGIARLAQEHNEMAVAAYEVALRKLETAIPWYTQDVTLSNSPLATEFVSRLMQRLVQGQALEVNAMLWNFDAAANGTLAAVDSGNIANLVTYKQSEQIYSIPFLVNTPRFAHLCLDDTATNGTGNTNLKALIEDGVPTTAAVFYSQDENGARSQEVGGLTRSATTRRYWSVPHVALNDPTGEKVVRRTNHVWSGLTTRQVSTYANTAGLGKANNALTRRAHVTFTPVMFRHLGMLYQNIQASNYTMPDVAITHPELLAWMDDQVWTRRQFTSSDLRAVFGAQVSFFLDTPVYADVMVSPVIVPDTLSGINNLAPRDKLYSMYFLTLRDRRGLALMLNNSTRPVQKRDVPVPADYFMGAYYIQLALVDPVAQGFAVNLKP